MASEPDAPGRAERDAWRMATRAIHGGNEPDPAYGAMSAPIYQTANFVFGSLAEGGRRMRAEEGFVYSRYANPTVERLERAVADLEGGAGALATGSGMAAISTAFLGLLSAGDHVVAPRSVYGGTRQLLEQDLVRFGIATQFVDTTDVRVVERALRRETKVLYLETPANPNLKLTDIAATARLAQAREVTVVIDNTFATPVLQRPLGLGAHVVVHSMTKYLNGHSDVIAGIVVARTAELRERLWKARKFFGGVIDPHQAWLVLRGLKTLPLRMRAAQENAQALAKMLVTHPAVSRVMYPGLPDHPDRELMRRQMDGPGAMLAFELRGGYAAAARVNDRLRLIRRAGSLGGLETLIAHPATASHVGWTPEARAQEGISDGMLRVSAGCEAPEDLVADLEHALDQA